MDETNTPEQTETEAPVTEAPEVTTVTETTTEEITTTSGFNYTEGCYNSLRNIETVSYYFLGLGIIVIGAFLCTVIIKTFFGRG